MIGGIVFEKVVIVTEFDLSTVIKGILIGVSGTANVTNTFDVEKEGRTEVNTVSNLKFTLNVNGTENYEEIKRLIHVELTAILSTQIDRNHLNLTDSNMKNMMSDEAWIQIKSLL